MGTSDKIQISSETKNYGEQQIGIRKYFLKNLSHDPTAGIHEIDKIFKNWQNLFEKENNKGQY